jgi:hypothetical protein
MRQLIRIPLWHVERKVDIHVRRGEPDRNKVNNEVWIKLVRLSETLHYIHFQLARNYVYEVLHRKV